MTDNVTFKNGAYELIRQLDKGNFTNVYLARRKDTDENVTLRTVPSNEEELNKAHHEYEMINQFNCPNIIRFVEAFSENMQLMIVTEYCPGGDLKSLIEHYQLANRTFSEDQVLEWAIHMFNGLWHLHAKNIIHRDLNPENIFLSGDQLKIGGMGLATSFESFKKTVTKMSSYSYICPEVIEHQYYTLNSDVWSAGCIIFELLKLKKAFDGKGQMEIFRAILNNQIPDAESFRYLAPILNKLFQRKPDYRPSSEKVYNLCVSIRDRKKALDLQIIGDLVTELNSETTQKFRDGRFVFEKKLGSKKSNINLVIDTQNNRNKAILKLASNAVKEDEQKRLKREADKLDELKKRDPENCRYILNLIDQFSELNMYCIVTEYCEEGELAEMIELYKRENKKFEFEQIRKMTIEMMSGLHLLHQSGMVHRNLKPSNIFWKLNQIKIGDFGMAANKSSINESIRKGDTLNYTSPEILELNNQDDGQMPNLSEKIDIWSAGCIIYEVACLKKAFDGQNFLALQNSIKMLEPQLDLKEFEKDKNKAGYLNLNELLKEMLNKNPDKRPDAKSVKERIYSNNRWYAAKMFK